jgi:hypothetical protein
LDEEYSLPSGPFCLLFAAVGKKYIAQKEFGVKTATRTPRGKAVSASACFKILRPFQVLTST